MEQSSKIKAIIFIIVYGLPFGQEEMPMGSENQEIIIQVPQKYWNV